MTIEIEGLDELMRRLNDTPKFNQLAEKAMEASLLAIWEQTGTEYYPPPPEDSAYQRTGTLGRTLGIGLDGGMSGKPDIYEVKPMGGGAGFTGKFGSGTDYAEHVVGENQAEVHQGRWLPLLQVAENAVGKITEVWNRLAQAIADYIDKG